MALRSSAWRFKVDVEQRSVTFLRLSGDALPVVTIPLSLLLGRVVLHAGPTGFMHNHILEREGE